MINLLGCVEKRKKKNPGSGRFGLLLYDMIMLHQVDTPRSVTLLAR